MITFPRAKINIALNILGKRKDGFHDIETIFYPTDLSDALEFVVPGGRTASDELTVTGFTSDCPAADNLVVRAVDMLRKDYNIPNLKIHLHKMIPPGSGLGGGSSDATSMLMLLNKYFKLGISNDETKTRALRLGSDCPFFVDGVPSIATGRGEIMAPLPCFLKGSYLVIIHEGIHISTHQAYQNSLPRDSSYDLSSLIVTPQMEWKKTITNDFEEYAFKKHPVLARIKKSLYDAGAYYSAMSGSGSAIYGLFNFIPDKKAGIHGRIIYQGWL